MPTRFTEIHISSPVSSMCLRAKDHLEGTKVAVFPSLCAPHEDQSGNAADSRSPKSGDLATRRGAGDPERRAEWTTVLRYGHLRSAPVVVDAASTQGVGTAYTPCIFIDLHAPLLGASLMASCLSRRANHVGTVKKAAHEGLPSWRPRGLGLSAVIFHRILSLHYCFVLAVREATLPALMCTLSSFSSSSSVEQDHNEWSPLLELFFHWRIGQYLEAMVDDVSTATVAFTCHFALDVLCEK